MNIVVERDTFAACLSRVAPFAAKSTIPVLECVKLEASGQMKLTASATDMDASISETIAASSDAPWALCVQADRLRALVASLPAGSQVTLSQDGVRLRVTSGRTKAAFDVVQAADYPVFGSDFPDAPQFSVKAGELDRVLAMLIPSICDNNTRAYLCGIHFCIDRGGVSAVSTDGHRMGLARLLYDGELEDFPSITLPRPTCGKLRALIKGAAGGVGFFVTASKLKVVGSNWELTTKLIDGTFPEYNRVLAPGCDTPVSVKADDFSAALERAMPLVEAGANIRFRGVYMDIEPGVLKLRGGPPDAPIIQDQLDAEYDGDQVGVGFNAKYMRDAVTCIGGGEVELHITDARSPFRINRKGETEESITIMPAIA